MANQSQKKIQKDSQGKIRIYFNVVIGISIYYVMMKFIIGFESIGIWRVLELAFFTFINRMTYMGIRSALDIGIPFEYYLDLYCINLAVQALCTISSFFWVIYLSVPGYVMFYAFKYLLMWANSTGTQEETEEEDGKKKKKQKVKYIKAR